MTGVHTSHHCGMCRQAWPASSGFWQCEIGRALCIPIVHPVVNVFIDGKGKSDNVLCCEDGIDRPPPALASRSVPEAGPPGDQEENR